MRFGTDGIRGVANTELTPSFALDLGRAAARVLGATCAVVGGDTRRSTPMLEAALVAGLASEGLEVHRLGVAPTPAIAYPRGTPRRHRSGGVGLAQPVRGQRHQAVLAERYESFPTRSRS